MKAKQLEAVKTLIQTLEKDYDFNDYVLNYVDEKDLKQCADTQEVKELIEKANENYYLTDTEVIYYTNAIEYLKENDQSLNESIEIAAECGYETSKINSELLASLLKSRNNQNDFNDFLNELETGLDEIFA